MRAVSAYIFGTILLCGLLSPSNVDCAKILGLFTSHSPSHFIVNMSVAKYLAEAGHELTVVSTQKPTITHPTIKHIIIPLTEKQERNIHTGMDKIVSKGKNLFSLFSHILTSMSDIITLQFDALNDERFTPLYNEKFDLVIWGFFLNAFQLKVAAKFKCPVIMTWLGPPTGIIDDYIGNPTEIAYVPGGNFASKIREPMSFIQRVQNFLQYGMKCVFKKALYIYFQHYYDKLYPGEGNYPTFQEMRKNVSLIFCNNHFSEGPIRPNVPAVIEIGGVQIKDKPDPLPKDIAAFLDTSDKDGFILFSLGSNLKGSNIKPEIIQIIFKTLASLKQKVIWKWEDLDNVPGKSPNILYKKWLPQDDILAHPNIRLFITHAGKGGVAEAQYHGVPMLALPVFGDQLGNAANMVSASYGAQLDLLTMTETEFKNGISEVLENLKYKANIKRFSELYRDRPLKARESVVYWTEYVLRHHGAQHMQSPLVHLNFFQTTSLDVIAVLLLATYIIFKIMKLSFRVICNKCRSTKNTAKDKKLKKK